MIQELKNLQKINKDMLFLIEEAQHIATLPSTVILKKDLNVVHSMIHNRIIHIIKNLDKGIEIETLLDDLAKSAPTPYSHFDVIFFQ